MAFYNALISLLDRIVRLASTVRQELYFPALVLVMGLLGVSICRGATITNLTDEPYSFTLQTADGQQITVDVAQGASQPVPGFSAQENEALNLTYHIQNGWAQTFFKPFSFLTRWGIGTSLVNEPKSITLTAAAFKQNKTISNDFKLVMLKTNNGDVRPVFIDGDMLLKALKVRIAKALKVRKELTVASRRSRRSLDRSRA